MAALKIGQIAKGAGVSVETVRFCEREEGGPAGLPARTRIHLYTPGSPQIDTPIARGDSR